MGLVRGINFNNNFYFFDMGKKVLNNLAYAIPHTKIYDFLMRNKETLLYNENKGFFGKTRSYLVNLQWYTFLQHRIYMLIKFQDMREPKSVTMYILVSFHKGISF